MNRSMRAAGTGVAALALAVATQAPASAATVQAPLATHLIGPLGLAVTADGTSYVAQTFTGTVTTVSPTGARTDVATGVAGVSGLTIDPDGSVVHTYSIQPENGDPQTGQLRRLSPSGKLTVIGRIGKHEVSQNPDGTNTYGFQGLSASCASQVPPQIGGNPYRGRLDTHPYAVSALPGGGYAVADAGANAVLKVKDNVVTTLTVLPPVAKTISAGEAAALHLPACVVGKTYNFEPVPTDVEVAPDGMLYVSSLAGGPEDGSLGALGGVFRVDPSTGATVRVGSGFAGATNLAIGPQGRVYVTELYKGRVSFLKYGHAVGLLKVPSPGAIEFARGKLYVTTDVLSPSGGNLTTITF